MPSRIALAVTARDEARLLPAQLAYHRLLGVEPAFVYLDDPDDATWSSIAHLDWVEVRRCVSPERFRGIPGLERFVAAWARNHTARQCLNVADAMACAHDAGSEWLLSIDADELVCLDRRRTVPDGLARALASLPPEVSAVRLPNLEVVQVQRVPGLVFRDSRLFKLRGGPERAIRDPRSDRVVCHAWFFGHGAGKSIVRLGTGAIPATVHRFASPAGEPLPTAVLGEILHYYAYDLEDWRRRCRLLDRSNTQHVSGQPVEPQKLLWIELVQELAEAQLEEYYGRTLALGPDDLRRLRARGWRGLLRRRQVVEVRSAARAFQEEPALQRYRGDEPASSTPG